MKGFKQNKVHTAPWSRPMMPITGASVRYESSWTSGNMPGITYTRERDVAPYVVYVKKMKMGEPP